MRVRTDYRSLSGIEKAAIFMLSLDEEHAAQMFENMGDEEIRELSQGMANLGAASSEIVERLYVEFAEQISSTGSLVGTPESTERLLSKVIGGERGNQIMEELRGPAGRTMWDKLANVNEHVLANYLKNEYPQTVAVIITKIRPDHAARVLAAFPETFSLEVINRMLRMEAVQKEVVDDIERTLRSEFMSNLARQVRHEFAAQGALDIVDYFFLYRFHPQHAVDDFQGKCLWEGRQHAGRVIWADLGDDDRNRLRIFVLEIVGEDMLVHISELVPHRSSGRAAQLFHDLVAALTADDLGEETLSAFRGADERACR